MPDHRVRAAAVAVFVVLLAASSVVVATPASAARGDADREVAHRPPVDAPVVDPFRPPATRYGPGNRGLTYDLTPGTEVRASGAGRVVFAGPVAGSLHVTVLHADGLRTSYSFLRAVSVHRGQRLARGDVVGTAGRGFHFGLRDGSTYLDPAGLFGALAVRVRLVPHTEELPPTDDGIRREHAALRELVITEDPGALRRLWNVVVDGARPLVERVGEVGSVVAHLVHELPRPAVVAGVVRALWDEYTRACTPGPVATDAVGSSATGHGRVAVLVAGLGSTSGTGAIDDLDTDALGYDRADVLRFSYGGGRIPGDGALAPDLAAIPAAPYTADHTNGDLVARGRALADLVEDVARTRPGERVDLYAHSLGGLVARVALLELAERPGGLDALGSVVTIGTPHSGADIATAATVAGPGVHVGLDVALGALDVGIDADGTAVRQLAETSPLIDHLRQAGVPDGVAFRTVAARGDLVVAADKADVPGHPSAIVGLAGPSAHDALPGAPAVTRELRLALERRPPACDGLVDAVLDAVVPETISWVTDALTLGVLLEGL